MLPNTPLRAMVLLLLSLSLAPLACRAQPLTRDAGAGALPGAHGRAQRLAQLRARVLRAEAAGPGAHSEAFRVNLPAAKLQLEKAALYPEWGEPQAAAALDEAEKALDLLDQGKTPFDGATGLQERAYISVADGSVQPYWVYVPRGPAPARGWPVLVYLHGYVPDTSKINPWLPDDAFWQLSDEKGFLVAVPYGRRNTDFEGIGEQDVLTVIEEVKRFYRVDEDRFFLGGPSMGGYGVYVIGLHYPHLFAGLAPMCGRSVPYVVEGRYPDKLPPFKRLAVEPNTPLALAENARHLPIFLQQGELDYLIDPQHSRRLAARWKELGYAIRYDEWKGHDHYIYWEREAHARVYDWAAGVRRDPAPRDLVYTTYTPKYGRAYWFTVLGISEWGQPARVRARVEKGNKVVVNTTNVSRYQLDLPASLVTAGQPLHLQSNDARQVVTSWKPGEPVVVEVEKTEPGLHKTASLCGPVREVFLSPFLLVPGTQGDDASRQKLSAWARRWADEWSAYADGVPPIRPDDAVTEADLRAHNLVLFGDRDTNRVLGRIAGRLPVEWTAEGYRLGERMVRATGLGLLMVYPNPLAPDRLVCVYSGEFWGDGLDANHKFDLAPDFILFRNELDGADPARTPRAVCAGYFDSRWRLSPRLTWEP